MRTDVFRIMMVLFVFIGCKNGDNINIDPLDRLPDNEAGQIVKKVIEKTGGWDAWESKKNFSFYKKITQLDSTGAVIRSVKQLHQYNLRPKIQMRMTWSMDSSNYVIINNGEQAKKYKEGVELTDGKSKNEAWNSSYGSHYVIGMPYKLTDPGVTMTYEGIDKVIFGRPVHTIKVEYDEGAGSTGGMHDWWYYFNEDDYDFAGFYLDYGNGYSLTTYEVFEDVDGMRFHNKRFSYKSNENREKVHLKTIYENEEMKFDQAFDSDLFQLK